MEVYIRISKFINVSMEVECHSKVKKVGLYHFCKVSKPYYVGTFSIPMYVSINLSRKHNMDGNREESSDTSVGREIPCKPKYIPRILIE